MQGSIAEAPGNMALLTFEVKPLEESAELLHTNTTPYRPSISY